MDTKIEFHRNFPHTIAKFDEDTNKKLKKFYRGEGFKRGFVKVGENHMFFPYKYTECAEIFYNFPIRKDDVWIFGHPRSGTTLTQETVWLLGNDLNFEVARNVSLDFKFPYFEHNLYQEDFEVEAIKKSVGTTPEKLKQVENFFRPCWETLTETDEPRFIKTHFPFSLMNPDILTSGAQIIYCIRNPKDVAVSTYHLIDSRVSWDFGKPDFEVFWTELFTKCLYPYGPYFPNAHEGLKLKNHPNVFLLKYSDLVENQRETLKKMAKFLGKTYTEKQYDQLQEYLKIDNFRKNPAVNNEYHKEIGMTKNVKDDFIRKGKVGGFRDYFSEELNKKADEWIMKNLEGTGFTIDDLN